MEYNTEQYDQGWDAGYGEGKDDRYQEVQTKIEDFINLCRDDIKTPHDAWALVRYLSDNICDYEDLPTKYITIRERKA